MHPGSPRASKHLPSLVHHSLSRARLGCQRWGLPQLESSEAQGLPSETGADALGFAIFSLTLQTPKWTPWAGGGVPMKRMA